MTVIASGLGATCVAKAQGTWGGTFMSTGQRTLPFKTAKFTLDPHIVQGGPYLAAGQLAALASTRVLTWQDAKVTLTGDVFTTGHALLLASALGTSATLTELGTSTAYELGGAGSGSAIGGASGSAPDLNSTYFDMQFGVPTTDGTSHAFSFHSGVITKAEWVFDRAALVSYSYDIQFQYVETATAALSTTEPTGEVPFSMATSTTTAGSAIVAGQSGFAAGTYGSEVVVDGVKKATVTLERKFATEAERMYMGLAYQENPVTNDYMTLTTSLEADYTSTAKTTLFDLLLAGTSKSLVVSAAVNSAIAGSYYPTFGLQIPSWYVDNPDGAPSPDGPKLVGATLTGIAHIDSAGDPWLNAQLITADTTF